MSERDAARVPVVVGVGQSIERSEVIDAVEIACRAARAAFDDAPGIAPYVQRLSMVAVSFSPVGSAPASEAASRLGLSDVACEVSTPGGNSPQWLVTRAADEIASGRLEACLVMGGEATRSMRAGDPDADFLRASRDALKEGPEDPVVGIPLKGTITPAEIAAKLFVPADVYPMLESARAFEAGRSLAEQRAHIASFYARMTEVAAKNPFAWFQTSLRPEEIGEPSDANRLTAEPYTKRMNSFPTVDQGAALLVTSLEIARNAGLEDRCVYIWSGASNGEPPPLARPNPGASPAIAAAGRAALEGAGVGIDDIGHIDIYSCFPSAVGASADALGIPLDDPRGLTTTGGMAFFGGPGNDYSTHGIASLVTRLRESGGLGLATANGGFLSKHSIGIYGTTPPPRGFRAINTDAAQEQIYAAALPTATEGEGRARVESGTVIYDRDGAAVRAPVMARLESGVRVVADADEASLPAMTGRSLVGETIEVSGSPLTYRA